MYALQDGADYGWPYCYQYRGRIEQDSTFKRQQGCAQVPLAAFTFPAHSSALGFAYFENFWKGSRARGPYLDDSYLVALQGSTKRGLKRGYKVVSTDSRGKMEDFVTGFLAADGTINGRPCDIFPIGRDAFLISDDYNGAIYYVHAF
jgi:glucose/arabinose dehydrogenase